MNLQIVLADSFFFVYYYNKGGRKWQEVGLNPEGTSGYVYRRIQTYNRCERASKYTQYF